MGVTILRKLAIPIFILLVVFTICSGVASATTYFPHYDVATGQRGNYVVPIQNAVITVCDVATVPCPSMNKTAIYSDNMGTVQANPITANGQTGQYSFWWLGQAIWITTHAPSGFTDATEAFPSASAGCTSNCTFNSGSSTLTPLAPFTFTGKGSGMNLVGVPTLLEINIPSEALGGLNWCLSNSTAGLISSVGMCEGISNTGAYYMFQEDTAGNIDSFTHDDGILNITTFAAMFGPTYNNGDWNFDSSLSSAASSFYPNNVGDLGWSTHLWRNLYLSNKIPVYDGLTTAGMGVVPILSTLDQTGVSTANSGTPQNVLASTPAAGHYRLSYYVDQSAGCATLGGGTLTVSAGWTDATHARVSATDTLTVATADTSTSDFVNRVVDLWSANASAITVTATYTACMTGTWTYDLHASVERME